MDGTLRLALLGAALLCGLSAGAFLAFSTLVLDGLRQLEPERAIAAMQAMNRAAISPLFLGVLLGAGLACAALAVICLAGGDGRRAWVVAAAVVYLVGALGLTVAHHVPLNDALAALPADAPGAADRWQGYLDGWLAPNHVRGLCALTAAGLLVVATW